MLDKIGKSNYLKLLKAYNFDYYPRFIGNPLQFPIISYDELWDNFLKWNGESACFNTHNAFRDIRTIMGKAMPQEIYYTSIHFDFDSPNKIENAFHDCIKLSRFLDSQNIPRLSVFTGGKGFQVFILLKPNWYKFDDIKRDELNTIMSNHDALKSVTRAIQIYLRDFLGLRTMDSACIGTPKKQSRALYSWHRFTRKDDKTNCVAIPLTDEMLYEWNVMDIIEYSHNPKFIIPEVKGKRYMTLLQIFEYFNIDLKEQENKISFAEYRPISSKVTDEQARLFLEVVAETKPCISSEMMSNNPVHGMRIAFLCFAKKLGKNREWFTEVYESIGYKIPYVDIYNKETRDYQINWLFDNANYNIEATCDEIKKMGKCLKNKCRRYRR